MQTIIRLVDLSADAEQIQKLDRSFTSDTIYELRAEHETFYLERKSISPPVRKTFPLDHFSPSQEAEVQLVASQGNRICALLACVYENWNKRLVIQHFYVDVGFRKQGIGRMLIESAIEEATRFGASTLWLETSNLNFPGVQAYQKLGFHLCGFDNTLYRGTAAEGETALFLARKLK